MYPLKKISKMLNFTSLFKFKKVHRKKIPVKVGEHHNLEELFDEVKAKYFLEPLTLKIDWFGRGSTNSNSLIRLGYYNPKSALIKINRILDSPHAPRYFISFIIYHEILHHISPPLNSIGSKRKIHHPEFKQKEKEFQEYELSQSFLKDLKKKLFISRTHKKSSTRTLG